jgi:hypothetical protein
MNSNTKGDCWPSESPLSLYIILRGGGSESDLFLSFLLFLCQALHSDDPASCTFIIVS